MWVWVCVCVHVCVCVYVHACVYMWVSVGWLFLCAQLQGTMGNETYFLWSFLVMGAVTVHLVLTTLEVYYRRRGLWNLTSLRTLVTSTDAEQNRYGRCSTLFLVVYLLLSLVADMVIFSVRLLIAFDMNGIISPFIYKNLYYIIVNLCYMHSLFVLLVQAEELKAGWIAPAASVSSVRSLSSARTTPDALDGSSVPATGLFLVGASAGTTRREFVTSSATSAPSPVAPAAHRERLFREFELNE